MNIDEKIFVDLLEDLIVGLDIQLNDVENDIIPVGAIYDNLHESLDTISSAIEQHKVHRNTFVALSVLKSFIESAKNTDLVEIRDATKLFKAIIGNMKSDWVRLKGRITNEGPDTCKTCEDKDECPLSRNEEEVELLQANHSMSVH